MVNPAVERARATAHLPMPERPAPHQLHRLADGDRAAFREALLAAGHMPPRPDPKIIPPGVAREASETASSCEVTVGSVKVCALGTVGCLKRHRIAR